MLLGFFYINFGVGNQSLREREKERERERERVSEREREKEKKIIPCGKS